MKIHGNTKHGYARRGKKTRAYRAWESMYRRCNLPSQDSYPLYGGRGIRICDRWRKFENFVADMGEPMPGHSLDRIDVNANYAPENCRWATNKAQGRNKRTNQRLTFNGETKCLVEWAETVGIKPRALWMRLFQYRWSLERALAKPVE